MKIADKYALTNFEIMSTGPLPDRKRLVLVENGNILTCANTPSISGPDVALKTYDWFISDQNTGEILDIGTMSKENVNIATDPDSVSDLTRLE